MEIPLSTPTLSGPEADYITDALRSGWVAPLGPHVDAFEGEIAALVGLSHAVALASGTAAIHLALIAAGVGPGDVVFCSDLTFAASCNPIIYQSATPVFIDSEPSSWNMCPAALESAFAKYPNAKAVIVVHLYGTPADMGLIGEICCKHGAIIIEDAAESLGSTYKGRQTGGLGHMGIFSFNGNKIITTSGGGMLLSNDEDTAKKAKFRAAQARDPARHYQHSELGYNYRLSNICAAIGRAQLSTLDERIRKKTEIYNKYKSAFKDNPWIEMNPIPAGCVANHWLSCITLAPHCPVTPLGIIKALEQEGAEARPIWKPMSMQPYYKDRELIVAAADCRPPTSHDIYTRGLCLPSDLKMTESQQERVCEIILKVLRRGTSSS